MMIPTIQPVQIPIEGHAQRACYGAGMASFRDVERRPGPLASPEGPEDEDLEALAENGDELRALVRETVHQELQPLAAFVAAMTRWASSVEAASARLEEHRSWR
jgi:hypothetical protein